MRLDAESTNDEAAPGSTETGDENRRGSRRRTLNRGKIMMSDSTVLDCTIRDLSEGGACLIFAGPTQVPESFWLLVLPGRKMRLADRLWQRGLAAGIAFTGEERLAPPRV